MNNYVCSRADADELELSFHDFHGFVGDFPWQAARMSATNSYQWNVKYAFLGCFGQRPPHTPVVHSLIQLEAEAEAEQTKKEIKMDMPQGQRCCVPLFFGRENQVKYEE